MSRKLESLTHHFDKAGLSVYLDDPNITELMLNPDGTLWIERQGEAPRNVATVRNEDSQRILNVLSDYHNETITANSPILECELPLDGSRFEGLIPPIVDNPSFVIRKKANRIFTFDDYLNQGTLPPVVAEQLQALIAEQRNIVVVGGTGSGKTTFVNALLHQVSQQFPDERIVILEDTNELQCHAPNHVIKRTSPEANVTMRTLLRTTLRYRPDRIIVGEVRGGEALELLKAWNTGHPGGIATIHADSALKGLSRFEQCLSEVTSHVNQTFIADSVHALVYMSRDPEGTRSIKELLRVDGFNGKEYDTTPLYSKN